MNNKQRGIYSLEGNPNLQKGSKLTLHKQHDQYGKQNHFLTREKHLQPGIQQFSQKLSDKNIFERMIRELLTNEKC